MFHAKKWIVVYKYTAKKQFSTRGTGVQKEIHINGVKVEKPFNSLNYKIMRS